MASIGHAVERLKRLAPKDKTLATGTELLTSTGIPEDHNNISGKPNITMTFTEDRNRETAFTDHRHPVT